LRFPLTILASALAAYALSLYLTVPANPEVKFWHEVMIRRDAEIAETRKNQPGSPIIFFTGGSSTAFSIDPKIIEETCNLPAFNLGLPVAAGGEYLIHQALRQTRRGDILVLCLEPDILGITTPEPSPSKFSFAMAAVGGHIGDAAGGTTYHTSLSLRDSLSLARPGAGYLATLAGRVASGRGYRYKLADIRYRGRIETPVGGASPADIRSTSRLSPYGEKLLTLAKLAAEARGVRLLYAMPWHFTVPSGLEESRRNQRELTTQIHTIIPTVDDGFTGAADNPAWFSDSAQHLTADGSAERTQALAKALARHIGNR
jgi:hypothetical protein